MKCSQYLLCGQRESQNLSNLRRGAEFQEGGCMDDGDKDTRRWLRVLQEILQAGCSWHDYAS